MRKLTLFLLALVAATTLGGCIYGDFDDFDHHHGGHHHHHDWDHGWHW